MGVAHVTGAGVDFPTLPFFRLPSEDFQDEDEILRALEREEESDYTMSRLREERMDQLKREWDQRTRFDEARSDPFFTLVGA